MSAHHSRHQDDTGEVPTATPIVHAALLIVITCAMAIALAVSGSTLP